jgi:hypothetical protein
MTTRPQTIVDVLANGAVCAVDRRAQPNRLVTCDANGRFVLWHSHDGEAWSFVSDRIMHLTTSEDVLKFAQVVLNQGGKS